MAQVSRVHNLAQSTQIFGHSSNSNKLKSVNSVSLRPRLWGASKSRIPMHKNGSFMGNFNVGKGNSGVFKVSASVAAAEKPSTSPEIVLEPIKDFSGTITLPGSKSLSNRILLLAALSEVKFIYLFICLFVVGCGNRSLMCRVDFEYLIFFCIIL